MLDKRDFLIDTALTEKVRRQSRTCLVHIHVDQFAKVMHTGATCLQQYADATFSYCYIPPTVPSAYEDVPDDRFIGLETLTSSAVRERVDQLGI